MDGIKLRAGEKLEALHVAARTAADNGKTRAEDVYQQAAEALRRIRESFNEIWQHELIIESRQRVSAFTADAIRRIKEGTPPLSPVLLYEELKALFTDRVWRRSVLIFALGVWCGALCGAAAGLRAGGAAAPPGPRGRALHSNCDQSVILVEDAVTPAAGKGEVLVRVQAFSVCPSDRGVLRGYAAVLRTLLSKSDVTVGRGFSGVVLDVGYGVTELELGDEVWGCLSEWSGGAASELITIRSTRLSKRPRGLAADVAASLPEPGRDMLYTMDKLGYSVEGSCRNKRVVIVGAGSGPGCLLVQLLAARGAHVTVSAPRHAAMALQDLGAQDFIDSESNPSTWQSLEVHARTKGPFDCAVLCAAPPCPPIPLTNILAVIKATAPRNSVVDLRPKAFISDRLPIPFSLMFAASFYTFRLMRWIVGCGTHTDWLEDKYRLTAGLTSLAELIDSGKINPVLDKVYLPQDFESALAHACSDDAIGTTVVRFP